MIYSNKIAFLTSFLCFWAFMSCSDDQAGIDIDSPAVYDFSRDGASTVSFSGQSTRIAMATELINAMTDFDVSAEALVEMYTNATSAGGDANPFANAALNASTKSIQSKVAASADFFSTNNAEASVIKADFETWINQQVSEVFPNENELAEAGKAGQIADGSSVRYINAKGLEYNQAVNKSLIGALILDQICNNYLSPAVLDAGSNREDNNNGVVAEGNTYTNMEHKWDEAYGYLFGQSTDASDPLATLGEDSFLNKYLSRVESNSHFTGLAQDIFDAFKLGRAAIVAGDYTVRDQQAEVLKEKLSTIIGVRAVYYLQNGKKALAAGDWGGAFHDLSEGFGFVYSLSFTRKPNSPDAYFSKSEVDVFINQMTKANGFWDLDATTLDAMSESIAEKFSFTVAEAAE